MRPLRLKSFTLIEVMVAATVLSVVLLALGGVYISAVRLSMQAKETNIVTDDLKDVLEKIKNIAFSEITTEFPDGNAINSNVIGGFLLDNETIVVRYPQGVNVDPLEIEIEATWTGSEGRPYSQIFKTIASKTL